MRTIAYNTYGCARWSPRGTEPQAPEGVSLEMAEALAALQPDILTFSEAPDESIVKAVGCRLGMEVIFFPSGDQWPGALLTHYPVKSQLSGRDLAEDPELFTRHAGRVTLAIPGGEMAVYSAHLHVKDFAIRNREVAHLVRRIEQDIAAGRRVLLQGDLNHLPTAPEYLLWKASGLADTWVVGGVGFSETIKADAPTRRIDYIWACPRLTPKLREARVVRERPFGAGGNGAMPLFFMSDHLPVMAEFNR